MTTTITPKMRYAFGVKIGQTLEQAYQSHHSVCPFCKNEKTYGTELFDKGIVYKRLSCSCGGMWEKPPMTKENLEKFRQFLEEPL